MDAQFGEPSFSFAAAANCQRLHNPKAAGGMLKRTVAEMGGPFPGTRQRQRLLPGSRTIKIYR